MLNEDRIKVMTKLAVFEKEHGKENEIASKFYKSDYVSYQMIWTGIMTSIAYILGLALYLALNFEYYMNNMHKMDLVSVGKIVIIIYLVCLMAMLTFSYFMYRRKYKEAQRGLKEYCDILRELERNYNNERYKEHIRQRRED